MFSHKCERERETHGRLMEVAMEVSKSTRFPAAGVNARVISGGTKYSANDKLNVSQLSGGILEKNFFFFVRYRTVMYYRHEPRRFPAQK